MVSPFGSGGDIGWAGAYVPMVVSAQTLDELRNMAGPPQTPGQKKVEVDLFTGEFAWKKMAYRTRHTTRRRRRR